jgi:hypothetical protein
LFHDLPEKQKKSPERAGKFTTGKRKYNECKSGSL